MKRWIGILAFSFLGMQSVWAQFMPMFGNMMPGMAQFQAMEMQRHQARTLLYREALEELRKNPLAADLPSCPVGQSTSVSCIPQPAVDKAQAGAQVQVKTMPASSPPVASAPVVPAEGRHLALLIGINAYPDPIPALETPLHDVTRIGDLLRARFGFEVTQLANARKADIAAALNALAQQARVEDSVLVMYAGHGYLMDDTKMGYWIPADASVKTATNWISNTDIAKFLHAIQARQLILVSDSCFSGSLTREYKFAAQARIEREEVLRKRAVLAFSSGGEEPVSDDGKDGHSIFAWSLIGTLQKVDRSTSGFEVFSWVRDSVTKEYPQEPQYGAVVSAGHALGVDYLLEPRTP